MEATIRGKVLMLSHNPPCQVQPVATIPSGVYLRPSVSVQESSGGILCPRLKH